MQIEAMRRCHLSPASRNVIKKIKTVNSSKDVRRGTRTPLLQMCISTATPETSMGWLSSEHSPKNYHTIQQSDSKVYLNRECSESIRGANALLFTAELVRSSQHMSSYQPQCPSVKEQIKKMWYRYTMECYSAIRCNVGGNCKHAKCSKPGKQHTHSHTHTQTLKDRFYRGEEKRAQPRLGRASCNEGGCNGGREGLWKG